MTKKAVMVTTLTCMLSLAMELQWPPLKSRVASSRTPIRQESYRRPEVR